MPDHDDGGPPPPTRNKFGQFTAGTSGNPNGRPVKEARNSGPEFPTSHDEMIVRIARQPVPQPDGTSISLAEAVVRRAVLDTVVPATAGASGKARSRGVADSRLISLVLKEIRQSEKAVSSFKADMAMFYLELKCDGEAQLELARRSGAPAPDLIPYPAHITITDMREVSITGPLDKEDRRSWELLKFYIKQMAVNERELRAALRTDPACEWRKQELAYVTRFRRMLMRKVPKGWNWREQVWNPDSDLQAIYRYIGRLLGINPAALKDDFLEELMAKRVASNWGFNPIAPKTREVRRAA